LVDNIVKNLNILAIVMSKKNVSMALAAMTVASAAFYLFRQYYVPSVGKHTTADVAKEPDSNVSFSDAAVTTDTSLQPETMICHDGRAKTIL
jgi:hypothetical protein